MLLLVAWLLAGVGTEAVELENTHEWPTDGIEPDELDVATEQDLVADKLLSHGVPAADHDLITRVPNNKFGRTYWERQALIDVEEIKTTKHKKSSVCKIPIDDASTVRALFSSWWLLDPNGEVSTATLYEAEHTKVFHMQSVWEGHFKVLLGMCEGDFKRARIPPTLMHRGSGLATVRPCVSILRIICQLSP
jgi:hypothetical protein